MNMYEQSKCCAGYSNSNSNSNSTFIALNLCQKTDSKAHHTKTLFNIQKPETLQGYGQRLTFGFYVPLRNQFG